MVLPETLNQLSTVKKTVDLFAKSKLLSIHCISAPFVAFAISRLLKKETTLLVIDDADVSERIQSDIAMYSGATPVELLSDGQLNLAGLFDFFSGKKNLYICDYQTILKNTPSQLSLERTAVIIQSHSEFDHDDLIRKLSKYRYQRKNYVEEVGDFAVRGSIVDIFSESAESPVRIDFFGDTIDSIRLFDPVTQRSIESIDGFTILPFADSNEQTSLFIDQVPDGARIIFHEPSRVEKELASGFQQFAKQIAQKGGVTYWKVLERTEDDCDVNVVSQSTVLTTDGRLQFAANKIAELFSDGYKIVVASSTKHLEDNFLSLLAEYDEINGTMLRQEVKVVQASLSSGFLLPDDKFALLTEHEIFGRRSPLISRREKARKFVGLLRRDLNSLRTGDFVVHEDYGIGKFLGMEKLKIIDSVQECVKIEYAEDDKLYVNVDYVGKLQRYASQDGFKPKLSKLGGAEWQS